ncbi:DUF1643 domain-containing protein [Levilactobacillus brevis]|uniref:DUF1643 domain-containing protein n=1 Tax=Levilactobacillus brevis TaxID=1580 RepID=UPI0039E3427D
MFAKKGLLKEHEAIFIMMNPSTADLKFSDHTTNMVTMCDCYDKVTLFNVFPYRGQPKELCGFTKSSNYETTVKKNITVVTRYIKQHPNVDVVFATGDLMKATQPHRLKAEKDKKSKTSNSIRQCMFITYNSTCEACTRGNVKKLVNCGEESMNNWGRHPSKNPYDIISAELNLNREKGNQKFDVV